MVGVKDEENIESVWVEFICKNDKIKLGNFTYHQEWKLKMDWKHPYFKKIRKLKVITC